MSNNPAADLARMRWEGTTEEERSEHGRMMAEAKNASLTKARRSEIASAAARARWGPPKKKKAKKK